MVDEKQVPITPESKVGEVLDAYPTLEEVLLEISPAFKKLRNPVLRRTVARVTNLRQAAKVGGVDLAELINRLREGAGIESTFAEANEESGPSGQPVWFKPGRVTGRIDVRPLLQQGEKPVGRVLNDLKRLSTGEVYELTAGFYPAPLIEMAREKGFETWSVEESPDLVMVYFCRPASKPEQPETPLVDLS
jgi:uncharacterized protein (DUF2249 family)